jgi:hypothetical protein
MMIGSTTNIIAIGIIERQKNWSCYFWPIDQTWDDYVHMSILPLGIATFLLYFQFYI